MASMLFGVPQAVGHTAQIWVFRLKHYYSPGLVTALVLMLPISIYGITFVLQHDLMQPWEWLYSLLYMVVGFAITQRTMLRMSGMKYIEFLRRVRSVLFGTRT